MATERKEPLAFVLTTESACGECARELYRGDLITLRGERGALCLACADLDHLYFLGAGDAALTRRAREHSVLSLVVLQWSRARKRYERQGVLVEEAGLARAEEECLADQDARARRHEREAERRASLDAAYVREFAAAVRRDFPSCPAGAEVRIAEHACRRYSGRVGRTAAAKAFDPSAVHLAVVAHIRHVHTPYDELLSRGWERSDARAEVADKVRAALAAWRS